ncbi:MAG TPA: PLP-dependent aminotransferase family protein [Steroidobacter sp.]
MLALASEPGMISLAGGHPDPALMPHNWFIEVVEQVLSRLDSAALQYGATEGLPALRESVSALLQERRIQAGPADVVITTGSQQGISLLMSALLEPGDAVVMAPHNYPAAMQAVRFAGGRIVVSNDDLEGLAELARDSAATLKAVYVVPSFANPTGHCMSLEARVGLLEEASRLGLCVIEDDPYSELWFDQPPPDSLCALNQSRGIGAAVAYLTSFSKILAPAFRLGAFIAPPSLRRAVLLAKQAGDVHTGLLEQHVLDAMLRSPRLAPHLGHLRALYRTKARTMTQTLRRLALDLLAFEEPAGGMFVWARRLAAENERLDAFEFGRTHRVLVLPGSAFSPDSRSSPYLRLSFANPPLEALREGIERLASGLRTRRLA